MQRDNLVTVGRMRAIITKPRCNGIYILHIPLHRRLHENAGPSTIYMAHHTDHETTYETTH